MFLLCLIGIYASSYQRDVQESGGPGEGEVGRKNRERSRAKNAKKCTLKRVYAKDGAKRVVFDFGTFW